MHQIGRKAGGLEPCTRLRSRRRPANLFLPGSGDSFAEPQRFSSGSINEVANKTKDDLLSVTYLSGETRQLAGRLLYGDYVLILPVHGLLDDPSFHIEEIQDIYIRLDFLAGDDSGDPGIIAGSPQGN